MWKEMFYFYLFIVFPSFFQSLEGPVDSQVGMDLPGFGKFPWSLWVLDELILGWMSILKITRWFFTYLDDKGMAVDVTLGILGFMFSF